MTTASDAAAPIPPSATSWPLVWLLCGVGVFCSFMVGKVPPALPDMRIELGFGLVVSGWIISIFNLLAVVAGITFGALADRMGYRRTVALGLALGGGASLAGALAPDPTWLLATRVVEGTGFVMAVTAVPVLLMRVAQPVHHRFVFGMWGAYFPSGIALIIAAAPLILALGGWRGLWLVNGGLLLVAALAVYLLVPPPPPRDPARRNPGLAGMVAVLTSKGSLLIAACFGAYAGQFLAVMGFLPLWLVEERGYSMGLAAALTAVAVALNAGGNITGGWLLQRGVRRAQVIIGVSAVMAVAVIGLYSPLLPDGLRYFCVIAFSTVAGMIPASLFSAVPRHVPAANLVGAANGLLVQGSNAGQMIGPPAVAALVAWQGSWSVAPVVIVTASVLTALLGYALGRLERRIDG